MNSRWADQNDSSDSNNEADSRRPTQSRGQRQGRIPNKSQGRGQRHDRQSDSDPALHSKRRRQESTPSTSTSTSTPTPTSTSTAEAQQEHIIPTATRQPRLERKLPVAPFIQGCRSVDNYEKLNRIEEGSYGIVYRARDRQTGEIVALKKLKLINEKEGFPTTSLREIHTLLIAKHPNIVNVKEIVTTPSLSGIFIVMEYLDHDLKSLMDAMPSPFLLSEIKTLMLQLLSAVACLHKNWIMHRDLKTSNLLMNNRGTIKVADFGLARRYGSPLGNITPLVVTLWYRAPELLLGEKKYTTAIDMWSIGCIFGELVNKQPLMPGRGEIEQVDKIFKLLGTPNDRIWPGFSDLPAAQTFKFQHHPYNNLRATFPYLPEDGLDLMARLLAYDPAARITAEEALRHPFFSNAPLPKDPELFPSFPSKAAGERRPLRPAEGQGKGVTNPMGYSSIFQNQSSEVGGGFKLRVHM